MGHDIVHPLGRNSSGKIDHNSLGDVYNVKDFGALGGGNNDTAAFQAVATAVAANSATNGATVLIPPDRYGISSTIVFDDIPSLRIIGLAGKGFQGDKSRTTATGGAVLEGMTSGMTIMRLEKLASTVATHLGPTVEGISFVDRLLINGTVNSSAATSNITGASFASGTITFNITQGQIPSGIVNGSTIWVNGFKISSSSEGITGSYNGRFTVSAVNNVSNPSTITVAGVPSPHGGTTAGSASMPDSAPTIHLAQTMTGLSVTQQTRWLVRRCNFYGLAYGLYLNPNTADVSWGKVDNCTSVICDHTIFGSGGGSAGAQTTVVDGGNFQYGVQQRVISLAAAASSGNYWRISHAKFDTLGDTSRGSSSIYLADGVHFSIHDNVFELEGDGSAIRIGDLLGTVYSNTSASGSFCFGNIAHNGIKANFTGSNGQRAGTAIYVDGADASTGASAVTCIGNNFNGWSSCYQFTANTRGCKVIGGEGTFVDNGIKNAGTHNRFRDFVHAQSNSLSGAWINDTGSHTLVEGCSDLAAGDGAFSSNIGVLQHYVARIGADLTKADNTLNSAGNITNFVFPVGANDVWTYEIILYYTNATTTGTSNVGGLKVRWSSMPTAGTTTWTANGIATSATSATASTSFTTVTDANSKAFGAIAATDIAVQIRGLYRGGGTAGTLQFQFAQSTTDAVNATTLRQDSFITARKIS